MTERLQNVSRFAAMMTLLDRVFDPHRKSLTVQTLAEEMGCSRRTIYRDLDRLAALGLQWAGPSPATGLRVAPGLPQQLHVLNCTTEELTALYFHLALAPGTLHHSALQEQLHAVIQKIGLHLGKDLYHLGALARVFTPVRKGFKPYHTSRARRHVALIVRALHESRECTVTYKPLAASRATTYPIQPYALFEYIGGLYLAVYRLDIEAVSVLSLERLQTITVLEGAAHVFPRRQEIDEQLATRRERAFGIIDDEEILYVELRFRPEQAPYIKERHWHPTQHIDDCPDGAVLLQFQASGRFEILRWILGWGPAVEVLHPADLRQEVSERLRQAARQYSQGV